jgi:hypothetical protein
MNGAFLPPVGLETVLLAVERRDVARHELIALDDEAYEVERILRRLGVVQDHLADLVEFRDDAGCDVDLFEARNLDFALL